MRLALIGFALACAACAQVVVKDSRGNEVKAPLVVRPLTVPIEVTCSASEIEPGETVKCTARINQPARAGGMVLTVLVPPAVTSPATVVVPAGGTSVDFEVRHISPTTGPSGPTAMVLTASPGPFQGYIVWVGRRRERQ